MLPQSRTRSLSLARSPTVLTSPNIYSAHSSQAYETYELSRRLSDVEEDGEKVVSPLLNVPLGMEEEGMTRRVPEIRMEIQDEQVFERPDAVEMLGIGLSTGMVAILAVMAFMTTIYNWVL
ncbi:hypothetical protein M231_04961 [Tremella mesenterica]|uniref:Uncharacterized protein n=1 Tax=Tremella mesenterica TaxID=5217 RepID=A0A4Q1BJI4_TREME|nr:uncharacterized protein TREMEDRAFT_58436 [Tremella mesenterica DSM 1558]EIW72276.1 hypothetical protein TREMEDRAFT_58436 [Tremella mesenterica DSM 1558]RXK37805.1 hypothetical protein M231_04961 [Tremella mesenterica]